LKKKTAKIADDDYRKRETKQNLELVIERSLEHECLRF